MLDETKIRVQMRTRLLTAAAIPSNLWNWENEQFDPPAPTGSVVWGRERLQIQYESRAMSATEVITGRMIYEMLTPFQGGLEALQTACGKIKDVFTPGTWLCEPDPTWIPVQVIRCERLTGRRDEFSEAWYYRPVVISWRAHAPVDF